MAKLRLNNITALSLARLVLKLLMPLLHTVLALHNLLTLMEPPSLVNLMLPTFLILPFNQVSLMRVIKIFGLLYTI
ncbi:hypothetical protein BGW37DRAFT_507194 [Umbelopsis sp. PMI_123]|nr:hypothetical protein BGW37DRAFT_507194 [Umbelopsis sp. PMI_123]